MEITREYTQSILDFLKNENIECYESNPCKESSAIGINRTSMCLHPKTKGLDENDTYQFILELIKEKFLTPTLYIAYSVKSDDDYFLFIYNK